jgi:hypothetical protein
MDGATIASGLRLLAECREKFDKVILASTQEKYRAAYITSIYSLI